MRLEADAELVTLLLNECDRLPSRLDSRARTTSRSDRTPDRQSCLARIGISLQVASVPGRACPPSSWRTAEGISDCYRSFRQAGGLRSAVGFDYPRAGGPAAHEAGGVLQLRRRGRSHYCGGA